MTDTLQILILSTISFTDFVMAWLISAPLLCWFGWEYYKNLDSGTIQHETQKPKAQKPRQRLTSTRGGYRQSKMENTELSAQKNDKPSQTE